MIRNAILETRVVRSAAILGTIAFSMLGGAGTASAAPPGFAGPFNAACKGTKMPDVSLGIWDAKLQIWRDQAAQTICAKVSDNAVGPRLMGVQLGRTDWATSFTDEGIYDSYAGVIYVSKASLGPGESVTIIGWVVVNGSLYRGSASYV